MYVHTHVLLALARPTPRTKIAHLEPLLVAGHAGKDVRPGFVNLLQSTFGARKGALQLRRKEAGEAGEVGACSCEGKKQEK